ADFRGARGGTILFVHGSSVSATPVFDLQITGKPEASTMDWFARLGYDTWCVDCEGYGRSDKSRPVNADVACGADDVAAASAYIDMSANLPVIDPDKIAVPTLVMRGQWDGIASYQDVAAFFSRLPNPDKELVVMPGIAHTSTRSKNWALVYHLLDAWFSRPAPVYVG